MITHEKTIIIAPQAYKASYSFRACACHKVLKSTKLLESRITMQLSLQLVHKYYSSEVVPTPHSYENTTPTYICTVYLHVTQINSRSSHYFQLKIVTISTITLKMYNHNSILNNSVYDYIKHGCTFSHILMSIISIAYPAADCCLTV